MMNDRLKFRVWDKGNEHYVDCADMLYIEPSGEITYACYDGDREDMYYYEQNDVVIEQCTGLKDKNGKLIFEGDIVSTTLSDGSKFKHIIRWYDGRFIADYGWYYHKEFEDYCSISQEWISKKEIIGNIHENHDLLEQSNDD